MSAGRITDARDAAFEELFPDGYVCAQPSVQYSLLDVEVAILAAGAMIARAIENASHR